MGQAKGGTRKERDRPDESSLIMPAIRKNDFSIQFGHQLLVAFDPLNARFDFHSATELK